MIVPDLIKAVTDGQKKAMVEIQGRCNMNERIEKLAEQAGLKVNADGEIGPAFFGSVDTGYKKFAELIVRECAKLVDDHDPTGIIEGIVLQHFGVEE